MPRKYYVGGGGFAPRPKIGKIEYVSTSMGSNLATVDICQLRSHTRYTVVILNSQSCHPISELVDSVKAQCMISLEGLKVAFWEGVDGGVGYVMPYETWAWIRDNQYLLIVDDLDAIDEREVGME
jgi:hypothetical protein